MKGAGAGVVKSTTLAVALGRPPLDTAAGCAAGACSPCFVVLAGTGAGMAGAGAGVVKSSTLALRRPPSGTAASFAGSCESEPGSFAVPPICTKS